jgi:hypothetical protein
MVSPNATGSESKREHAVSSVAESGSHAPPGPKSVRSRPSRILADHKARAKQANNTDELGSHVVVFPAPDAPSDTVPLARVTSRDEINSPVFEISGREGSHVVVPSHVGPVFRKDTSGIGVDLALP